MTTNETTDWIAEEIPDEPTSQPHLRRTNARIGASAEAVEQHNLAAENDDETRWRNMVVGTTEAAARRTEQERRAATQARNAELSQRVAAGGGSAVTSSLRGPFGESVAVALGVDPVERTHRRLLNAVEDERQEAAKEYGPGPAAEHLGSLIDQATAVVESKKGSVPAIVTPHIEWLIRRREIADLRMHQTDMARAELKTRHKAARRERIAERLPEVDQIVVEFATEVLDRARAAAVTLESAGLSPDSTSDEVLATLDIEAQKAWHAWRSSVSDWSDVQSARRYVATESGRGRGAIQGRGEHALTPTPGVDIAATVWRSQFVGAELPAWCGDAHSALRWWITEMKTHTPRGVIDDVDQGQGSDDEGNDQR